jgi:nucleotide-binding universal stress UspA family protein
VVVKCAVCGAHVLAAAAVEIPVREGVERFCSLRCATSATGAASAAPLPPLPEPPRRILVAIDGSGPSLRATELAAVLARTTHGSVTLLHAIDPALLRLLPLGELGDTTGIGVDLAAVEDALRRDAEAQLARCRQICEQAGVPHRSRIELAPPARAIVEAANEADLVVIGSRGLGALSGVALGSLSHRVIGDTKAPVLVVH